MKTLQCPLVHLNGTGKEQLLSDLQKVGSSLRKSLEALSEAAPNQRDYYPMGDEAWRRARKQHEERVRILRVLHEEVALVAEGIMDGATEMVMSEKDIG